MCWIMGLCKLLLATGAAADMSERAACSCRAVFPTLSCEGRVAARLGLLFPSRPPIFLS